MSLRGALVPKQSRRLPRFARNDREELLINIKRIVIVLVKELQSIQV